MNLISICEKCKIQPLSLKGIGFNEFAFTYEQIKKIIEILRIKKYLYWEVMYIYKKVEKL